MNIHPDAAINFNKKAEIFFGLIQKVKSLPKKETKFQPDIFIRLL